MDKEQSQRKRKRADEESTEGASTSSFISREPTGQGDDRYDVFLSFRGLDTRKEFTDHLYRRLVNSGTTIPIFVFKDDNNIPIGEEFCSQIFGAISRSKISIPIISKNYATSKWCLRELIHMMDCKNSMSHMVLPIFYKVKPSDVRDLKGDFGDAFHLSREHFDEKDIQEGPQALRAVSGLQGWESDKFANGHEGELVEEVVQYVLSKLQQDFQLDVTEQLVGIGDHVNKIRNWVDNPANVARMIGIYGMGGIGKTTLAKAIYNQLSNDFVHRSFLADIRETTQRNGIPYLQKQLIKEVLQIEHQVWNVDGGIHLIKSRFKGKKVLILLDDIDNQNQLEALAREQEWFASGSIIIVTTRYKAIVDQSKFELHYPCELEGLNEVDSLLLFKRHAFRMDHSLTDFEFLSRDIVSIMSGLPLALKIIGSYLYNKTNRGVWEDVLRRLRKEPHGKVEKILKISYDALDPEHREIFLDIACFLIGEESKYAIYMWADCEFYPNQGIEELKQRCLIKFDDDGKLRMHDQLRDLGRKIVCKEGPPERRSRLWEHDEAYKVLMEEKGTKWNQTICLDKYHGHRQTYTNEQFKNLQGLRFLQLGWAALSGDFNKLFSELRWLQIQIPPNLSLLAINLHLPKLVVLELSSRDITEHWRVWSSIKTAKRLKVLDLTFCEKLTCTPDLSAFKELQILILQTYGRLEQIHPSIGKLKSLIFLDMSYCRHLKELPEEVGQLKELKVLILDYVSIKMIPMSIGSLQKLEKLSAIGCDSLEEIHSSIGNLSSLQHLDLWGCCLLKEIPFSIGNLSSLQHLNLKKCRSLKEIPSSIGNLSSLQHLNLKNCGSLREIPSSIGNLSSLQHLNLKRCSLLRKIPSSIGDLQNLQHLDMSFSGIEKLPSVIGRLKKLQRLSLMCCNSLKGEIPSEIGDLSSLEILNIRDTSISDLPERIRNLFSLQCLNLEYCDGLRSLPELPSSLTCLSITCQSSRLSQLSYLIHLRELLVFSSPLEYIPELPSRLMKLHLEYCPKLILPKLDGLKYLEELSIKDCSSIDRLNLPQLNRLKRLYARECKNLVEIQGHDNLEFLEEILIEGCTSIKRLILPELQYLKQLEAKSCDNLVEIQGLDKVKLLESFDISNCGSIERLPDPPCFATLKDLKIIDCCNLRGFESLRRLLSCQRIYMRGCQFLEKPPDLSKFENLEKFTLKDSLGVTEIPGIEESRSIAHLNITGCESIQTLPNLSGCEKLKSLVVRGCKKLTQLRGLEKLDLSRLDVSGCDSLESLPKLPGTEIFRNYEVLLDGLAEW